MRLISDADKAKNDGLGKLNEYIREVYVRIDSYCIDMYLHFVR